MMIDVSKNSNYNANDYTRICHEVGERLCEQSVLVADSVRNEVMLLGGVVRTPIHVDGTLQWCYRMIVYGMIDECNILEFTLYR
jgi:hypothetical protein